MIPKSRAGRPVKYPFDAINKDEHIDIKGEQLRIASAAWHHAKKFGKHFVTRTGLPDLKKGHVRVYRDK